jgi:hypothetical protein
VVVRGQSAASAAQQAAALLGEGEAGGGGDRKLRRRTWLQRSLWWRCLWGLLGGHDLSLANEAQGPQNDLSDEQGAARGQAV